MNWVLYMLDSVGAELIFAYSALCSNTYIPDNSFMFSGYFQELVHGGSFTLTWRKPRLVDTGDFNLIHGLLFFYRHNIFLFFAI